MEKTFNYLLNRLITPPLTQNGKIELYEDLLISMRNKKFFVRSGEISHWKFISYLDNFQLKFSSESEENNSIALFYKQELESVITTNSELTFLRSHDDKISFEHICDSIPMRGIFDNCEYSNTLYLGNAINFFCHFRNRYEKKFFSVLVREYRYHLFKSWASSFGVIEDVCYSLLTLVCGFLKKSDFPIVDSILVFHLDKMIELAPEEKYVFQEKVVSHFFEKKIAHLLPRTFMRIISFQYKIDSFANLKLFFRERVGRMILENIGYIEDIVISRDVNYNRNAIEFLFLLNSDTISDYLFRNRDFLFYYPEGVRSFEHSALHPSFFSRKFKEKITLSDFSKSKLGIGMGKEKYARNILFHVKDDPRRILKALEEIDINEKEIISNLILFERSDLLRVYLLNNKKKVRKTVEEEEVGFLEKSDGREYLTFITRVVLSRKNF